MVCPIGLGVSIYRYIDRFGGKHGTSLRFGGKHGTSLSIGYTLLRFDDKHGYCISLIFEGIHIL